MFIEKPLATDPVRSEHLLHAIETGEPLLFVDDIAIRRLEKGMSEGDGSGPLDVTMQVSSFLPKGGGR